MTGAQGYLCLCGISFPEPKLRTVHMVGCEVWRDDQIGAEALSAFPRDKYGGYVIVAPAALVAKIRAGIAERTVSAHAPQAEPCDGNKIASHSSTAGEP